MSLYQFIKSSWNNHCYMLFLVYILLVGVLELRHSDLLDKDKGEDHTQSSVIPTDITGTVLTKDVECQFNYLIPSLGGSFILPTFMLLYFIIDQLEYLEGTGVHIAGKTLFLIRGERTQSLNWEEYGIRINVPQGIIPPGETCEVSIAVIVGGILIFPLIRHRQVLFMPFLFPEISFNQSSYPFNIVCL